MTSLLNPIHHLLFFFIFFFFTKISCSSSDQSRNSSSINFCPEIERHSLLTFKQSLQDPGNLLSSWDGEAINCCKWEGIVCNNSTGHVSHLHLRSHDYYRYERGYYVDAGGYHLGGKVNPSLLNLKHLTFLDLSNSNFSGETIPSFIGSLSSLEYLNLSFAGFEGKIPPNIGNLSNLHTLDLGGLDYVWGDHQLESGELEWLLGLSKLEYLNLNSANLSRASKWGEVINSLPRLLELHLSVCSIDSFQYHVNNLSNSLTLIDVSGNSRYYDTSLTLIDVSENRYFDQPFLPIPQWFFQLEYLVHLDLSSNYFSGQIPTVRNTSKLQFLDLSDNYLNSSNIPGWVYSCKDLKFLDLRGNSIGGQISESIGNLTSLQSLDLSGNQLSGKLPTQITSLCRLQSLALFGNELGGDLKDSFRNMSECFLGSLQSLDLSYNQLSGHLTERLGEFKLLEGLYLSHNSLSGRIPISIGNIASLVYFEIGYNKFTGNLPVSLGQLSQMLTFDVMNNRLEGVVTESHFANLSNLETFHASENNLTLSVGPDWTPPKRIMALGLGSVRLGSGIPSWLQSRLDNIDALDLSDTGISGAPPTWFFDISFLNISNNNLHGRILYSNSSRASRHIMSWNNFSGSLPRIGGDRLMHLDLSHNHFSEGLSYFLCHPFQLVSLSLEGNRLSGELPDCWQKWPSLLYLNLGNNLISGRLPNSLGFLHQLWSLNLYGNKFSGQIPFSMRNCTSLKKMDLGRNSLDGSIPTWIGTGLTGLSILNLHSNKFSGGIPLELCHLQSLQILDLSRNRISGIIPKCVHNLTAMATKRELNEEMEEVRYDNDGNLEAILFRESASIVTKGSELEYSTILSLVTNIDLSSNHLRGGIPKELTSLVELRSLNLSRNQLSGSIPESIGEMKQLESLDLSSNFLSGQIPNNFTLLSSLSFLNLSFNNLSGRIPQSTQLQTMDASRFIGNDLCGPPLTKNCSSSNGEDVVHGNEGEERKGEIEWMYVFLSAGYAVGFSGVCSVLVLKKRWREVYFGMLEMIWDKLYVYFHVWIKKF